MIIQVILVDDCLSFLSDFGIVCILGMEGSRLVIMVTDPKSTSMKQCMNHMEVLGVEPKIRQLVAMYLEMAYKEGADKERQQAIKK